MQIYFLSSLIVCFLLTSCAMGGRAGNHGTAGGGKVTIPVTVTKYGQYCETDYDKCIMQWPLLEGSACSCFNPMTGQQTYGSVVQR